MPDEYLVQCSYTDPKSCYEATRQMLSLENRPTCILLCDDFSSTGALRAADAEGLRVPEDVSLAGYDGIDYLQNLQPRLTTVDQDAESIGQAAAQMLISQIEGARSETRTVPARLISGETVRMVG